MRNSLCLIFVALSLLGCKSTYKTVAFDQKSVPEAPDYSYDKSWAVLPGGYPQELLAFVDDSGSKKADVFYIYPTLLTNKKDTNWNSDVENLEIRKDIIEYPIALQASAWAAAGNIYAPFYRQTHYRIFVEPFKKQGLEAWELAYRDVSDAFAYYLEHYNQGKPIIIAAHSQGSFHAIRLLKEFFDGQPLQKKLIVAYLAGANLFADEFKNIPLLETPNAVGGFVSWNTYKMNKFPKDYEMVFKGRATINPITWDTSEIGSESLHRGLLFKNGDLYPNSLSTQTIDGLVWSSLPKIPNRFFMSFIKNYHFADVNLFWKDIQQNALLRVEQWFANN